MQTTDVSTFVNINTPRFICFDSTDNNIMYCTTENYIYQINVQTKDTSLYLPGWLSYPAGIVSDDGNVYYVNRSGRSIMKVTPDKDTTTFASTDFSRLPMGLCFDSDNQKFYCSAQGDSGSFILEIDIAGNVSIYASGQPLNYPLGITLSSDNNDVYTADGGLITKTIKDITNNTITSIYGRVPNARAVAYKNNIVYCSTSGDTIYAILPNGDVHPLVTSDLISDTRDIINGPMENNRNTFYVTNYGNGSIVKIVANNTIYVDPVFNKVLGTTPFSLNAISTSTSQIYYASNNIDVATVDDSGIVTVKAVGTCTITLTQTFDGEIDASASTTIEVTDYLIDKIIDNNEEFSGIALDLNNSNIMYAVNRSNSSIQKINLTTKELSWYGGLGWDPYGIAFDGSNVYVSENNTILKFTSSNISSVFADNLPNPRGLYFDISESQLYGAGYEKVIKINTNGIVSIYSTNIFEQFLGIAIDESTKDIYVNTNSSVFKVVINSDGNITTTKLADISNARGIVFVNGVIYCSTSDNTAYQIVPGNVVTVLPWISSSLLTNSFSIISGLDDGTANTFYVSTGGNGILNIIDSRNINITSEITVQSVFNKTLGATPFNMNATSNNPSTIRYSSSNTNVAEVDSDGVVTIIGLGNCTIEMAQDASNNDNIFYSECSAASSVNVNAPIITVVPLINKILTDSQFTINATSDSPLPINYVSSNISVVAVGLTTGEVTIMGVGTAFITSKQFINDVEISSGITTVNIYSNEPFGNVTAMNYDNSNNLLYVYSNNEYPYNFITIDGYGNTSSLNIYMSGANITCINTDSNIYVGGTFNTLSGNQNNVNISELKNVDIPYSTIQLSVNNTFVDSIESNQTIGIITTDNGKPFEISKK
jgi:hypothetical protein